MNKIFFFVAWFIFLAGCASSPQPRFETFIRDTTYVVVPPVIADSGFFQVDTVVRYEKVDSVLQIKTDTVFRFVKVKNGDTVADIRVEPLSGKISYKIQPDAVCVNARDTLQKSVEMALEKEGGSWATSTMAALGVVGLIIALVYIILRQRKNGTDSTKT